jgi:hypothetical protein
MEGGGEQELFKLGDIGDYHDVGDATAIASATITSINIVAALTRTGVLGGFSLNSYFDTFGLEGILANTSLIVIIFQLARWVYTTFYASGGRPWSPFVFVCMLIGVQTLHDLFFYYGVIKYVPSGNNEMIDALKKYSSENGSRALAGHSVFLIFVAAIAMILKEYSLLVSVSVVTLTLYMLPYVIATFGPRPPAPPPPPPAEKKGGPDTLRWNGSRM